ncbi:MAG: DUF4058 family protein [Gemmataceae bacterium]|nr:DUF4058 family protein [Gemmataceae bacterium]
MPLQDHFHPPLYPHRQWHGFHHAWASTIAFNLNHRLPQRFFAEPNVQFGIEIDVATLEDTDDGGPRPAVAPAWLPPGPALIAPIAVVADVVEVRVYRNEGGFVLAGAIELVSPSNKDPPASRTAFVSKCAAYIQQGVGLVIVDVVTERLANLHDELLARLEVTAPPLAAALYAAAYRPVQRDERPHVEVWQEALAIGAPLPTMPLCLRAGPCIPLDLEATYEHTSRELRIPGNGA